MYQCLACCRYLLNVCWLNKYVYQKMCNLLGNCFFQYYFLSSIYFQKELKVPSFPIWFLFESLVSTSYLSFGAYLTVFYFFFKKNHDSIESRLKLLTVSRRKAPSHGIFIRSSHSNASCILEYVNPQVGS